MKKIAIMSDDKWIQKAIEHPGAFTKKAEDAGMTTNAYEKKVLAPNSKARDTTKKQARLAKTLEGLHK